MDLPPPPPSRAQSSKKLHQGKLNQLVVNTNQTINTSITNAPLTKTKKNKSIPLASNGADPLPLAKKASNSAINLPPLPPPSNRSLKQQSSFNLKPDLDSEIPPPVRQEEDSMIKYSALAKPADVCLGSDASKMDSSPTSTVLRSYESLTFANMAENTGVPQFKNEFTERSMTGNHERLHSVTYCKIVDMSYLCRKIAEFFLGASMHVIDILSDTYFASSLYTDPRYEDVPDNLKTNCVIFLVLSTIGWFAVSFIIAYQFRTSVGWHDISTSRKISLFSCLWTLVAFDCPLFLISLPQRVIKVCDIKLAKKSKLDSDGVFEATIGKSDGRSRGLSIENSGLDLEIDLSNSLFLLGYKSRGEWKASTHYGLFSHLPSFFLEDIPLFILNLQIAVLINSFTFVSSISLTLSLFGIFKKGKMIFTWCRSGMKEESHLD